MYACTYVHTTRQINVTYMYIYREINVWINDANKQILSLYG